MKTIKHSEAANTLALPTEGDRTFAIVHDFPRSDVEEAWRDCLSRVEFPAHYDSPEFFEEPRWVGEHPFAVLALDRGCIVGVLTGLHGDNHVISGLQSRPQICVDRTAEFNTVLRRLAQGLLAEAGSAKLITIYSWSSLQLHAFESCHFRRKELEGDVVLDLTEKPEALFKQLHASRRKNIRQAIRRGIEVFPAKTLEDAEAFYRVHASWHQAKRKKIETPQIPWEAFSQRFCQSGNFVFMLARYLGQVIAGITLRFFPGGLVEFSNHSSLEEFLHLKPNDLLQWKCVEWACREGFRRCSFGGAHTFHRRFGGTVVPISRYRLDRTLLHRYDRQEATLDLMRGGFRKLPRPLQRVVRRIANKEEPCLS
jgi:hypothetical protein